MHFRYKIINLAKLNRQSKTRNITSKVFRFCFLPLLLLYFTSLTHFFTLHIWTTIFINNIFSLYNKTVKLYILFYRPEATKTINQLRLKIALKKCF